MHYHELGKMQCTKNFAHTIVIKLHLPIKHSHSAGNQSRQFAMPL